MTVQRFESSTKLLGGGFGPGQADGGRKLGWGTARFHAAAVALYYFALQLH